MAIYQDAHGCWMALCDECMETHSGPFGSEDEALTTVLNEEGWEECDDCGDLLCPTCSGNEED